MDLSRFKAKKLLREDELKTEKKAAKRDQRFAGVLLKEAAAACKALKMKQAFVWIWLQYLAWQADGKAFAVTNEGLRVYDIDRKTKMRALATFEKAGLISVVRHKTKAPVVTMLVATK